MVVRFRLVAGMVERLPCFFRSLDSISAQELEEKLKDILRKSKFVFSVYLALSGHDTL